MPDVLTPPEQYWSQPPEALFSALQSSPNGLSSGEAAGRLGRYGPNTLRTRARQTPLGLFLNQFKSPILIILLVATAISAMLKDWTDAIIIVVIILGSAGLSFFQEYSANDAAEKLQAQVRVQAHVVRDGRPQDVPAEEVVPGDVDLLSAGSLVPADGIILEARDFFLNQAVLTGETFPVEKRPGLVPAGAGLPERTNCVFMGTSVRSGSGKVLIVRTGRSTAFGQVAERLALRPPLTEFEHGIRRLGYLLSETTLVLVLAVFAINVFFAKPVLDSLLFSLALAVGLTPQLLPAIININLSRGSLAMAKHGVIVRRLASIEDFGSMDILCTDKTGTVTEGVVRLDQAVDPQGRPSERVLLLAYLNAHFQTGMANPLDEAINIQGEKAGLSPAEYRKVDEIPYDFVRKRLSVVVRSGTEQPLLITKGALENILAICSQVQDGSQVLPLDDGRKTAVLQRYTDWSGQGFRVLGVATRAVEPQEVYSRDVEEGMTLAGFLLFFDPPKADVQEAIADLAGLGVRLKLITGDNKLVALHVAQAIGMPVEGVLTGAELGGQSDSALWRVAERTTIFAQVDPNQKERIIMALQKTGHVVGFMGDGINDAPALHAADVGISVNTAVDVAKEAADFVLREQSLAVLGQGIVQGRRTLGNTLKYVFMATSANFGNMFSVAGASLFLPFLPMLPKQILLINFLTDLPEMTIATDTVDEAFLKQPHRWDIGFVRRFMLIFGPLSSVFDYLTFGALLWLFRADQAQFHTGWYIESVLSAAFVVFAVRTRLPFFKGHPSRTMLSVTVGVAAVTVLIPYTPLARIMGFQPLPPLYLLGIAVITIAYFLSAEGAKRWFYRREGRRVAHVQAHQYPRLVQVYEEEKERGRYSD